MVLLSAFTNRTSITKVELFAKQGKLKELEIISLHK